jgi:hypothetical protein
MDVVLLDVFLTEVGGGVVDGVFIGRELFLFFVLMPRMHGGCCPPATPRQKIR